jgi:hypothetical protein
MFGFWAVAAWWRDPAWFVCGYATAPRYVTASKQVAQHSSESAPAFSASLLWSLQASHWLASTWQESTRSQQRLWLGGANLLHELFEHRLHSALA